MDIGGGFSLLASGMRVLSSFCFAGGLSLLAGCGDAGTNVARHDLTEIRLDPGVPELDRRLVAADLNYLADASLAGATAPASFALSDSTLNPAVLQGWLKERVRFVLHEETPIEELDARLQWETRAFDFPEPFELPLLLSEPWVRGVPQDYARAERGSVLASNVGAALYLTAKKSRRFDGRGDLVGPAFRFRFGDTWHPVHSPRVGLVMIGPTVHAALMGGEAFDEANRIFRLGVLFHEARHSDGSGRSAAFLHAICPAGHMLEGRAACDLAPNGPYGLEADLLSLYISRCASCTEAQLEMLRLQALDDRNRVLESVPRGEELTRETRRQLEVIDAEIECLLAGRAETSLSGAERVSFRKLGVRRTILRNRLATLEDLGTNGLAQFWRAEPELHRVGAGL